MIDILKSKVSRGWKCWTRGGTLGFKAPRRSFCVIGMLSGDLRWMRPILLEFLTPFDVEGEVAQHKNTAVATLKLVIIDQPN